MQRYRSLSPQPIRELLLIVTFLFSVGTYLYWKSSVSKTNFIPSLESAAAPTSMKSPPALSPSNERSAIAAPSPPNPPAAAAQASVSAQIEQLEDELSTSRRTEELQNEITISQARIRQLEQQREDSEMQVTQTAIEEARITKASQLSLETRASELASKTEELRSSLVPIDRAISEESERSWWPNRLVELRQQRAALLKSIEDLQQQARDLRNQAELEASQAPLLQHALERQRREAVQQEYNGLINSEKIRLDSLLREHSAALKQEADTLSRLDLLRQQARVEG